MNDSTAVAANNGQTLFNNTVLRKQSCNELISRLKSRKILGLNCDFKGETYRSKISQLLGNSETVDDFECSLLFTLWLSITVIGSHLLHAFNNFYYVNFFLKDISSGIVDEKSEFVSEMNTIHIQMAVLHFSLVIIYAYSQTCNNKSLYRFLMIVIFVFSSTRLIYIQTESKFCIIDLINNIASLIYFMIFSNIFSLFDRRKLLVKTFSDMFSKWLTKIFSHVFQISYEKHNDDCKKNN